MSFAARYGAARYGAVLAAVAGLVCWCAAVSAQQEVRPSAEESSLPRKAFFGTQVGPVTKEVRQRQKLDVTEGVVFVQVFPRTTAAEADFKPGDVILSVDGSKIADIAAFLEKVRTVRTGDTLTVEVVRDGARSTKKVTMREKPRETSDAYDITYGQVSSRGSRLRTIVTRPKAPGQHPAVLLIQGYGCVSIDNLIGELDPYGWLARDLTLHGYVVMRVDRPGCGDSEGGPCKDVDFETELDGYRQALKALKGFAFVDADNVFLFGHSMGGIMAPFLAADDTVKGVAVYGTTSRSWFQVILELRRRVMMFDRTPVADADRLVGRWDRLLHHLLMDKMTPGELADKHPDLRDLLKVMNGEGNYFWGRHYLFHHQMADRSVEGAWARVQGHVLTMWGKSDWSFAEDYSTRIAHTVNQAHPGRATSVGLDGVDHTFFRIGSPEESFRLKFAAPWPEFNPVVLETLRGWLAKEAGKSAEKGKPKRPDPAPPSEKAPAAPKESPDARTAMYERYLKAGEAVKWNPVRPHWLADGNRFWYAAGAPEHTTIYLVDPKAGTRQAMFDVAKVRKALAVALGREPAHAGLPFARFTFAAGETKVRFTAEGKHWELDRAEGTLTEVPAPAGGEAGPRDGEVASPDGRLFVREKDHNVYLRKAGEERARPLTDDGTPDDGWIVRGFDRSPWRARWSPDGSRLATFRVDQRRVPKDPIVHFLKAIPEVTYSHRSPPGEPIPHSTVYVFHAATGKRVRIDTRPDEDRYVNDLHWLADGSGLLLLRGDREQKRIDVLAADLETGATRVILTESSKTWVGPEPLASRGLTPLSGGRFLWASERDGWNQLYLYDRDGRLLRRLTAGEFPVVRVLTVDEKAGWVYFAARPDRERPYDTHLCRVDLEGRRFARLTEGTGQHGAAGIYELYPAGIDFSPSGEYFIDTHSDLDRPFAADLRAADGRLVRTLERADVSGLAALKWKPPEPFVVKAADGTTDIYGVLYKPYDFDPARKYPVLDHIYNAPWAMWVPKTFNSGHMTYTQALAQLGFVIVVVDGRGTPNRGKAFHDLIYGRQYRIEVPDHVAAIKQLARKRPYLDLTRVGIFGGSNGGYLAVRAALTEPDFFRAAAALAPPVDRASMAADFQEPYLGLPDRNPGAYAGLSLVPLAEKLKGKLLLAHGTADENVPFGGTMRLASALIEAGRDFDLLILPGQGHDPTGRSLELWQEKCRRHFQDYLRP